MEDDFSEVIPKQFHSDALRFPLPLSLFQAIVALAQLLYALSSMSVGTS